MPDPLIHPAFKHILSIGYEFETHELAKFRTQETGSSITMVNTYDHPKLEGIIPIYFDMDGKSKNLSISIVDSDDVSQKNYLQFKHVDDPLAPLKIGRPTENGYQFITLKHHKDKEFYTGIEWIITYELIKPSALTIKRTFLDAVRRIANELETSTAETVDVYPNADSTVPIGKSILRKVTVQPDTYYFQMHPLQSIRCVPQMTFRCHVSHARDIIVALLPHESRTSTRKRRFLNFSTLCKQCDACVALLEREWQITGTERGYLFLIVYVIHQYLLFFKRGTKYFKDLTHVNPRHFIKDFIKKLDINKLIQRLTDIEEQLVQTKFYKSIVHWPLHEFVSYMMKVDEAKFTYGTISRPSIDSQQLITTHFKIINDEVFIESRELMQLLPVKKLNLLRGTTWKQVKPSLQDHILNPTGLKYTKKCDPTQFRNPNDFKCQDRWVPKFPVKRTIKA